MPALGPLLQARVGGFAVLESAPIEQSVVFLQLPDDGHLDTVLEVRAHAGSVLDQRDRVSGELVGRADAGQL